MVPARKTILQYAFATIFALTFLMQFNAILGRSHNDIRNFFAAKADYVRLRNAYTTFKVTNKVKELIPPGSQVGIIHLPIAMEMTAAQYNLYPTKIHEFCRYLIDFNTSIETPRHPSTKWHPLSENAALVTHKDRLLTSGPRRGPPIPSLFKKFLLFLITVIIQTVLGVQVLCLLKVPVKVPDSRWMISMGYLTGFCIFTAALWLLLLSGFTLDLSLLLKLGIILICLLLLPLMNRRRPVEFPVYEATRKSFLEKALLVFTSCLVTLLVLWIVSNPVKDWDTMANWAIKSKVIFHQQGLNIADTKGHHNYYPILWPLHIAAQFTVLNGDYDEVTVWSSALMFLVLLLQLSKGFRFLGAKPIEANLCLLAYIAYFTSQNPTISALPENAFLCFLTGLLLSLCLWMRYPTRRQYLALSLLMAAGLSLIKLEGAVTVGIIVVSVLFAKKRTALLRTVRPYLLGFLAVMVLPVLWALWVRTQGFSGGIAHFQKGLSLSKLALLAQQDLRQFLEYGEVVLLFFGVAYFVFFPNPRQWTTQERFLLCVSVLLLIFKWVAPLGWSEPMLWARGIFNETSWRLFLHAGPSLMLLFCSRAFVRDAL